MSSAIRLTQIIGSILFFMFACTVSLGYAEDDSQQASLPPIKYTFGFDAAIDVNSGLLKIVGVDRGSPAQEAGLEPGDLVWGIDYKRNVVEFLVYATRSAEASQPRTFTIQRGGEFLEFDITPIPAD